jgi:hypothetical protein
MCFLQLDTMVGHVDDSVQSQKLKTDEKKQWKIFHSQNKCLENEIRSKLVSRSHQPCRTHVCRCFHPMAQEF